MDKFLRNKLKCCWTGNSLPAFIMAMVLVAMLILLSGTANRVAAAHLQPLNICAVIASPGGQSSPAMLDFPAAVYNTDPFNMDLRDRSDVNSATTEKHITCYPNPAISYINFKFDKSVPKEARLYVFSFTGKKMDELPITGQVIKITLDKYYRGLYVYQLRSAGGAILESGKFQVKN